MILQKYDNRNLAATATMVFSSLFHEYALSMAFGFFYPVLTLMYFNGIYFYFATLHFSGKTNTAMNTSIFASLILGIAIQTMLIPMEWYARLNCRPVYKVIKCTNRMILSDFYSNDFLTNFCFFFSGFLAGLFYTKDSILC